MSRQLRGVEVCLESLVTSPNCPHGPTLLFEEISAGRTKRFYACSACRDRKLCNFYQLEGDRVSADKQKRRDAVNASAQPSLSHRAFRERYGKFMTLPVSARKMCVTCSLLLLKEDWGDHVGHVTESNITDDMLQCPTDLLLSKENNKANAQYLFAEKTMDWIISSFEMLKVTHILCVGTPRIHEYVQKKLGKYSSFLLDMDHRYGQFYSEKQFSRYNMFNHHFFGEDMGNYRDFLQEAAKGRLLVTMDPPFGGLLQVLAHTLRRIGEDFISAGTPEKPKNLPMDVVLFFPYFNEPQVTEHMPYMKMSDYKVNYENHTLFKNDSRMKQGSPVRVFTNIELSCLVLPKAEGYRFCKPCQKYVSKENQHCPQCNSCTSKDGRTYKHCDRCDRCVKPSKCHCDTCGTCQLPQHSCGTTLSGSCFLCAGFGHKKKECPYKQQLANQDRKSGQEVKCQKRTAQKSDASKPQRKKKKK